MCGIAGVVGSGPEAVRPIAAMTAALRHRGPDDEGYVLVDTRHGTAWPFRGADTIPDIPHPRLPDAPPAGADLAFGHRRLSILDLTAGGHGPMASADGRLWITYNGEIFNYLELRAELATHGHTFRTASDTEVLLAAYAQWGPEALHRLNGMWAFALYDARDETVFCARDRFGVKPFHYYWDGRLLVFASEIKGVLAHPAVPRNVHESTLVNFLLGGQADEGDQTFFDAIRSLPAGHQLTLRLGPRRVELERWYTLPEGRPERAGSAAEFQALLEDAVRLRLRSDVDVGTCLSGGLDSSSIVSLTARLRDAAARGAHRAFSIVYPEPGLDESRFVDAVVAATGVGSVRTTPTAEELLRDLPALVRHQDEPFPSASPYSQWRVMRLAREAGVTVLLDGQGADEVLAGYHYQLGPFLAETGARRGTWAALQAARRLHVVTGLSLAQVVGQWAYHAWPWPRSVRAWAVARFATQAGPPHALMPYAEPRRGRKHAPCRSLLEERRRAIGGTSLPALLRYEDRNSMAFAIEARTPFLDYRLVERALALPAPDLVRDGWTKAILRDAMTGILPDEVRLRRDKVGFATPERRWLREIAPQVREWLGRGSRAAERLEPRALAAWLAGDDATLASRPGLWRLVCAELWLRYVAAD